MERGSGLLVHISSLPSKYGIGTFGSEARRFVRFLNESKQKYWQILPLNPTSYGDSPYQSFSAFALNPYFIDLDYLVKKGYLTKQEVKSIKGGKNPNYVDYGIIYQERFEILKLAYSRAINEIKESLDKFLKRNKKWLDDYALFMTIKDMFGGKSWQEWPNEYRKHNRKILLEVKEKKNYEYYFYVFLQFEAYLQYNKLRKYANKKGIKIIGDMPIYVALDSADVWSNHKLFLLNSGRKPKKVAGVPPDFFSSTGQLWGNPIYDYEYCKKTSYRWWKMRFKMMSKLYDLLRIDHFRGFDSYWTIPSKEKTAINGMWEKGPGFELFKSCEKEISKIQIIAEDLGIITDSVKELKEKCGFPGLKVYQFAFEDYKYESVDTKYQDLINPFLPHNYEKNSIAYIGTHDNDIEDNFIMEHPEQHKAMLDYLNIEKVEDINDTLIGSLMRSNADVVIFMPQDILRLGANSRINTPGVPYGNWQFRFRKKQFDKTLALHLSQMVLEANR